MAISSFKWFFAGIWLLCSGGFYPEGPYRGGSPGSAGEGERSASRHPLYISVTEISYNIKEKTLEISCKIFTNDFETVLGKLAHAKVDLSAPKDKKAVDKLIADYVEKHLQLKIDGKAVPIRFAGSEKEAEATWSYFQANDIAALKKIEIRNSLLYDSFDQEINIMHVSVGGVRKSTRLNYPDEAANLEF